MAWHFIYGRVTSEERLICNVIQIEHLPSRYNVDVSDRQCGGGKPLPNV